MKATRTETRAPLRCGTLKKMRSVCLLLLLFLSFACNSQDTDATLIVTVLADATVTTAPTSLGVEITLGSAETQDYPGPSGKAITFPATLSAQVALSAAATAPVKVTALNAKKVEFAAGSAMVAMAPGQTTAVTVTLTKASATTTKDLGTPN
jgi:hypothetical protein